MDLLQQLSEINSQLHVLQRRKAALEFQLESHVKENGEVKGYGVCAHMKPGKKRTDHEAAAKAAGVPRHLIEQLSTTKTTVKWAEVTKVAKVDTAPFVTVGKPSFVIDFVEVK